MPFFMGEMEPFLNYQKWAFLSLLFFYFFSIHKNSILQQKIWKNFYLVSSARIRTNDSSTTILLP